MAVFRKRPEGDKASMFKQPPEGAGAPESGKPSPKDEASYANGLAIGLALGVALGLALDNLAIGIAIGVALGVAMGSSPRRRDRDDAGDGDGR